MPQMKPMNWILLYIIFLLLILKMNILNYFLTSKTLNKNKNNLKFNPLTWKW